MQARLRCHFILAGLVLLAGPARPANAETPGAIVAVFGIEDKTGQFTDKSLQQLTNYLSTLLAQGDRYRVVPPGQIRSRLRKQKVESYRKCYDEKCQIEIGRELAAEKVLSSKVVQVGTRCAVLLTLYDLRGATTEASASRKTSCTQDAIVAALDDGIAALKRKSSASPPGQIEPPAHPRPSKVVVGKQRITGLWLGGLISLGVLYLTTIGVTAAVCDEGREGVDCGKAIGYAAIPVFGPIPALADSSLQSTDGQIAGLVVSVTTQLLAAGVLMAGLIYKRPIYGSMVAIGPDESWLSVLPGPIGRTGWGMSIRIDR